MELFGYEKLDIDGEDNRETPLCLSEVSFRVTSKELKIIIEFLKKEVEEMERQGGKYEHDHFQFFLQKLSPENIADCNFGTIGVEPEITVIQDRD
jgi:hypothetical protein